MNLQTVEEKILEGKRIAEEEALNLLKEAELLKLGWLAHKVRMRLHPENIVTFLIDRNINYTNVCVSKCKFCAFCRDRDDPDAYIISDEELYNKIKEAKELGATSILLQGGLHPDLDLEWICEMLKKIKEWFPNIHIHGLSAPEIVFYAKQSGVSLKEALRKLKGAGLGSIPGGGAEVLSQRVRDVVSPNKCTVDEWFQVMETAHKMGIRSSATMMFGHIEEPEDIVHHLSRLRKLQDETGGFTAFIPWLFQPKNTPMENVEKTTTVHYLRVLAVSRIFLDNIPNIQASWVTQGGNVAQVSLFFGANDFGSLMIEENVVKAAGVTYRLKLEEILRLIKSAGFRPAQRTTLYQIVKYY
ncbi:menaquinone biosynthesis protein [Thermosulfidibacter takaii ABI70S6]|uniref:Cyclic dehypoxanthine futalosine synthase n=1 Tax=Thermosulfidibacter takaii (strain DSM 17441 / JCM 13301 / NBRC 103674 / ABI70S6) TaxID=1298851 RepID=A0A0S3QUF4_THET7|nr:cyclic dehypoxanthinyl futalosine synthase [Thermosulfidibacter takaii]BAT71958.1 menaquinone biosynthesis protein [Thermosulfidibacter takaii ABI70S6]